MSRLRGGGEDAGKKANRQESSNRAPLWVLVVASLWFVLLVGLFFIWITTPGLRKELPKTYGHHPGIPVEVPWFGAMGGLAVSLGGIAFYGRGGWESSFNLWHALKPALGAITGGISCVLLVVILRAGTGDAKITTDPTTFDASAFVFGYAEEAFRQLITTITNVFVKPGQPKAEKDPPKGPAQADGTNGVSKPAAPDKPAAPTEPVGGEKPELPGQSGESD